MIPIAIVPFDSAQGAISSWVSGAEASRYIICWKSTQAAFTRSIRYAIGFITSISRRYAGRYAGRTIQLISAAD
jgi:hypothetical protein